jgi:hypothetical protein
MGAPEAGAASTNDIVDGAGAHIYMEHPEIAAAG